MEPSQRKLTRLLDRVRRSPHNTRFSELCALIEAAGIPFKRQTSSHVIYEDEPAGIFLNIQKTRDGKAKAYQARDVVLTIEDLILKGGGHDDSEEDT